MLSQNNITFLQNKIFIFKCTIRRKISKPKMTYSNYHFILTQFTTLWYLLKRHKTQLETSVMYVQSCFQWPLWRQRIFKSTSSQPVNCPRQVLLPPTGTAPPRRTGQRGCAFHQRWPGKGCRFTASSAVSKPSLIRNVQPSTVWYKPK